MQHQSSHEGEYGFLMVISLLHFPPHVGAKGPHQEIFWLLKRLSVVVGRKTTILGSLSFA